MSTALQIVLATNLAETAITIPDVTLVVDSGAHNITSYDTVNHVQQLRAEWCARA